MLISEGAALIQPTFLNCQPGGFMKANRNVLFIAASSLAIVACTRTITEREIVREQPIVQPQSKVEHITVVQPPAPPEQKPPPPASSGYSWVDGHYVWRDGRWTWEPGRWITGEIRPMPPIVRESPPPAPGPSAKWVPGYWSLSNNEWVWVRGHWQL